METVAISGNPRTDLGKKANKAIRKEGLVPCVIYGGDNVVHFTSTSKSFKSLIYTPEFKLAEVTIDGQAYNCILKDAQFHPVTDNIVHLDFLQLIPNKKVNVNIPVGFKGTSPGVKGGGTLIKKLRTVKIKTTPEHVVNMLFTDISTLELGDSVRVKDVEISEHMEIMNPAATPVASVEVPRALRSAEDEGAAAEGAAEAAEGAAEAAAE